MANIKPIHVPLSFDSLVNGLLKVDPKNLPPKPTRAKTKKKSGK